MKLYKEIGVEREKPFIERDVTTLTEQAGYLDTEAQVRRMLFAGENLRAYKRAAYEFPEGEFDINTVKPDPTLDVGFDPADADMFRRNALERIKVAQMRKAAADSLKNGAAASAEKSGVEGTPENSAPTV